MNQPQTVRALSAGLKYSVTISETCRPRSQTISSQTKRLCHLYYFHVSYYLIAAKRMKISLCATRQTCPEIGPLWLRAGQLEQVCSEASESVIRVFFVDMDAGNVFWRNLRRPWKRITLWPCLFFERTHVEILSVHLIPGRLKSGREIRHSV